MKCGKDKRKTRLFVENYLVFLAPLVGLEPTTYRLTAERSTNWAKEEYLNSISELYINENIIAILYIKKIKKYFFEKLNPKI